MTIFIHQWLFGLQAGSTVRSVFLTACTPIGMLTDLQDPLNVSLTTIRTSYLNILVFGVESRWRASSYSFDDNVSSVCQACLVRDKRVWIIKGSGLQAGVLTESSPPDQVIRSMRFPLKLLLALPILLVFTPQTVTSQAASPESAISGH